MDARKQLEPRAMATRVRVLDSTRSQRNDANDARSVAIVALRHPNLRVVTSEDHVAVLRMLAKRHEQFSGLKTRAAARLHAVLTMLVPSGLASPACHLPPGWIPLEVMWRHPCVADAATTHPKRSRHGFQRKRPGSIATWV